MDNELSLKEHEEENIIYESTEKKNFAEIPVEVVSQENEVTTEESTADVAEDIATENLTGLNIEENGNSDGIGDEAVRKSSTGASLDDIAEIPAELEAQINEGGMISVPIEEASYRPDASEIPCPETPTESQHIEIPISDVQVESDKNEPVMQKTEEGVSEVEPTGDEPTEIQPPLIEIPVTKEPSPVLEIPVEVAPEKPEVLQIEPGEMTLEQLEAELPEKLSDEPKIPATKPFKAVEVPIEKKVSFQDATEPEKPLIAHNEEFLKKEDVPNEPLGGSESPKKPKTRSQLIEEVRRNLECQLDLRGIMGPKPPTNPPPAQPSHVTFNSWAPPQFHAPVFRPLSSLVDPKSKVGNEHTVGYAFVPPQMAGLNHFDDLVKVGPYSMALWSTDKALARGRSMERRGRLTTAPDGLGLAPLKSARCRSLSQSAPVTRSSSSSNLMDYVHATRSDLRRSQSKNRMDENAAYYRYDGEIVKMALQTQKFVNALNRPYESTVGSFYEKYASRPPYCPYAAAVHYDHLYPRDASVKRRLNRWLEDNFVPQSVGSMYEVYFGQLENDLYKEREQRCRLEREAFYTDRQLDHARKQAADARNAYSALDFSNYLRENERFRQNYNRTSFAHPPVVKVRRYFYPYA